MEAAPNRTAEKLEVIETLPQAVKELRNRDVFASLRDTVSNPQSGMTRQDAATLRNQVMQATLLKAGGVRQEVMDYLAAGRKLSEQVIKKTLTLP